MRPQTTARWILVTGSTDGIGRQTAVELTRAGHHVLVHGRDAVRVDAAVTQVQAAATGAGADVRGLVADLSSLDEVRSLAAQVRASAPRLDVLINNAGTFCNQRVLTADGFETTFAVNHLAPFLLTNLLTDLLAASAPARVVTVASVAHQSARLDFADLQGAFRYDGYTAYALSKLCNILFTYELADRLGGAGAAQTACTRAWSQRNSCGLDSRVSGERASPTAPAPRSTWPRRPRWPRLRAPTSSAGDQRGRASPATT